MSTTDDAIIAGRVALSWRVVGGAEKGGILVREGRSTASMELEERLATGAIVAEEEHVGDRLCYRRLSGSGPDSGWVSIRLKGKPLLEKIDTEISAKQPIERSDSQAGVTNFVPLPRPVPDSRKPRVLFLAGTGHSLKVIRAQIGMLLNVFKSELEICFVLGRHPAKEDHFGTQAVRKVFPNEELFQYTPFRPDDEREALGPYADIEGAIETIEATLKSEAPIDAVIGFSMGSNLASVLAARACLGIGPPLRCVVHLSPAGFPPDFLKQVPTLFTAKLPIPALVSHGIQEPFPIDWIADLYASPEIDQHSEGHRPLPADVTEARALARRIKNFVIQNARVVP